MQTMINDAFGQHPINDGVEINEVEGALYTVNQMINDETKEFYN